ncbi:hypothetical protein OSB04_018479 [Centaurea solstitialis]|uniref:Uncharacterized protein n=1 Tax=Centaurea solstitialis TaxID=347529 RepID=A0AA38WLS7_9ASTR|nr:hypothetical protein OSB04_018479 [Centaurea solstitialis]
MWWWFGDGGCDGGGLELVHMCSVGGGGGRRRPCTCVHRVEEEEGGGRAHVFTGWRRRKEAAVHMCSPVEEEEGGGRAHVFHRVEEEEGGGRAHVFRGWRRRKEAAVHMCSPGGGGGRRRPCTCVHRVEEEEGGGRAHVFTGWRRRKEAAVHMCSPGGGGGWTWRMELDSIRLVFCGDRIGITRDFDLFPVNWSLAFVIVVAESKWGFSPLMRSSYLIKGMRSVSVLLLLYYGVFGSLMVTVYTNSTLAYGSVHLRSWPTVLLTVLGSYFVMMCMLMSTAGNAVLYMYCKAKHGELALEVDEQFAYIDLPQDDDEKVPLIRQGGSSPLQISDSPPPPLPPNTLHPHSIRHSHHHLQHLHCLPRQAGQLLRLRQNPIHLLQFFISLAFLVLVGSIVAVPQNLGLGFVIIDYENSVKLTSWFHAVIAKALLAILVYFQVSWSLAFPIVVAESKWGFAALRRSWYLAKGMRSVSLSLLLDFGGYGFPMVYFYTNGELAFGSFDSFNWWTLVMTTTYTYCLMTFMLIVTVRNTVLYMYCKAKHGELALEVDEKKHINSLETPPAHSLSFTSVISESKRIVRANYDHFSALSYLFFPLAFTILVTPAVLISGGHLSGYLSTAANYHLTFLTLYVLTLYILSLSAIATTTYSTYIVFQGDQPINFSASVKTLATSFFQILSTSIVIHLLLFCIPLAFFLMFFVGSIVVVAKNLELGLGFVLVFDYAMIGVILLAILVFFQVIWSLAFPIIVAESKWGFAPLIRSWYLVKGARSVSLSLLLFYGVWGFLIVLVYTNVELDNGLSHLHTWSTELIRILGSICLMMFMLMSTVGNTVLIDVHCERVLFCVM